MIPSNLLRNSMSRYWLTSDCKMGLCYFTHFQNDFDTLPHTHAEYNFVICLDGRIEFSLRRQSHTLEPGDFLVVNPGEVHESRYGTLTCSSEGVSIILTRSALTELLEEMDFHPHSRAYDITFLGKKRDIRALRLAKELVSELRKRERGYETFVRSLVFQMVIHLLRHSLEPLFNNIYAELPRQLPCWQMNQAMEYLSTHGKSTFNLSELCLEIGSCPSRFILLFRNSTKLSPHVYHSRLLVRKAQIQLRIGQPSVKEVAYSLGFQNVSHFCEIFKGVAGMTPRTYQVLKESQRLLTSEPG